MPKTATKAKSSKTELTKTKTLKKPTSVQLNSYLKNEIARLAETHEVSTFVFEKFAHFVIENYKKKESTTKLKKAKSLTLDELKASIYQHFSVKNTTELKNSGTFKMATDGMDSLNFRLKDAWEQLYRKFIGILPGKGKINGLWLYQRYQCL